MLNGTALHSLMHLTLFIPDLLWPDHADASAFDFAGAESLARLLFLADYAVTPYNGTSSWESVLAESFGLKAQNPPLATLRLMGGSELTGPEHPLDQPLICADPVNLDFIQQYLVLSPIQAQSLSPDEANALLQSLNEEFKGEGTFFQSSDHLNWYFAPASTTQLLPNLAACSRIAGRRIDADESRQVMGRDGLRWLNRIQMCLNGHPVNEARQLRELPAINSLWPWGAGALSASDHAVRPAFQQAIGHDPLLRGLCTLTHTAYRQVAEAGESLLLLDTRMTHAVAEDDLALWQCGVQGLIKTWIAPALLQLANKELETVSVIAPGARSTQYWTLHYDHPALRPNVLQRLFGRAHKHADLATLVKTW